MKSVKLIDAKPMLDAFFGDLFKKTDQRIMSAARHGVSDAINRIKEKTKSNISSSWFNSSSSRKYGIGLIEGVKAYLWQGEATGFVDILGNTRTNDGTWRLRLFEGGTKERKSKHGKSYGRIRSAWFFSNAVSSIGSDAVTDIQNSIQTAIDEINNLNG